MTVYIYTAPANLWMHTGNDSTITSSTGVCVCVSTYSKHRKTPSKLTKSTACIPRGNRVASHGRKTSGSMLFGVALWYFFVFVYVVRVSQLLLTKQMERGWYNGSGGVCPLLMTLSRWQVWWPHSGGPDQTQGTTLYHLSIMEPRLPVDMGCITICALFVLCSMQD